jgi:6-pyruvoyltetrahydropterin/6-carboxytetrahydropterin synthase
VIGITGRYEIDMGHCLADHRGKCHRPHGHRYVVEATVVGPLHPAGSEAGMVLDFAGLRDQMAWVLDGYDHRFVMARDDERMGAAVAAFGGDAIVPTSWPPTAENLAAWWGQLIASRVDGLASVVVHETPNCRATWRP